MSEKAVGTPKEKSPATLEQILVMLQQADFAVPEPYLSEIVNTYGYVQRLVSRIHRKYGFEEEPAHVFNPLAFEPEDVAAKVER
jgi:hypothetical protein